MKLVVVAIAIGAVACGGAPSDADPPNPPSKPAPTPIDARPADAPPDAPDTSACKGLQARLEAEVTGADLAMENWPHHKKAVEQWNAMPPACRSGRWYLAASRLIALGESRMEVDSIALASQHAALTAALAQPDDLDVLTRVAQFAVYDDALAAEHVVLPADACKRARALTDSRSDHTDAIHYICARAALIAGNPDEARRELDAIADTRPRPEIELARAEVATSKAVAKQHAQKAIELAKSNVPVRRLLEADRPGIIRVAQRLAR